MNRKILIRVTAPAVLIGLFLLAACIVGAFYINQLQANLTTVLRQRVQSSQAAQRLEISVRQLRFRSLLYLAHRSPPRPEPDEKTRARLDKITEAQQAFKTALAIVRETAAGNTEEMSVVEAIQAGYDDYRNEMDKLRQSAGQPGVAWLDLVESHPINQVVDPCEELVGINDAKMKEMLAESERVSQRASWVMLLLGLCGPLGGIAMGYGVARGLSHSIYRLSVRVQDVAQRLDRDIASVSVAADGDLQNLDRQLEYIIRRVEEATESFRQQQRELIRAEQLAAVGHLAAGVAHEIRNPLTGVKLLIEAALRAKNQKPLTDDDLRVIHREIGRLEQTVQGLLDLARLPPPQRNACDLREVVSQAADLVRGRAEQQHVELALPKGIEPILASVDRGQWHKVLVNLFINALDNMPHGGVLEVQLDASPRGETRVSVTDTGSGISPEILPRLFTPFTTTKSTGTGLGLSICRRIVEEHGGRISASNRPEGGACFAITLPPSQESGPKGQEHGVRSQAAV
jgi:signal transduction histidine kinase